MRFHESYSNGEARLRDEVRCLHEMELDTIKADCDLDVHDAIWKRRVSRFSLTKISGSAMLKPGIGMSQKPFLKWAGGKRWLTKHADFDLPSYTGKYLEPFLGSGAVFFSHLPSVAVLSDANQRLVEVYQVIKTQWKPFEELLLLDHNRHCKEHYYARRSEKHDSPLQRAVQFVYLNRACWNGLYRVNLRGEFNVPIGSKNWILSSADDFESISDALQGADLIFSDFEATIEKALEGDLIFADPPYTVAHNFNGFVKYNESIFSWDDQIRLRNCLERAALRGAKIICTNADHPSIRDLYADVANMRSFNRQSIISGRNEGRTATTELILQLGPI